MRWTAAAAPLLAGCLWPLGGGGFYDAAGWPEPGLFSRLPTDGERAEYTFAEAGRDARWAFPLLLENRTGRVDATFTGAAWSLGTTTTGERAMPENFHLTLHELPPGLARVSATLDGSRDEGDVRDLFRSFVDDLVRVEPFKVEAWTNAFLASAEPAYSSSGPSGEMVPSAELAYHIEIASELEGIRNRLDELGTRADVSAGGRQGFAFEAYGLAWTFRLVERSATKYDGADRLELRVRSDDWATFQRAGPKEIGEAALDALVADAFDELGLGAPSAPVLHWEHTHGD